MKISRLILLSSLALFILACSFLGWNPSPQPLPTLGVTDPTAHALETLLAQPIVATATGQILPVATLQPANTPIPTSAPALPTANPAACLIGTWQATNIQDYVIAAISPEMMQEYRPEYKNTTGQAYVSFFENGLVTIQAYKLVLEFEIQAGIFRVGLLITLDGLSSGQYQADGSQLTTNSMTTTGLTASARALEQDVMPPEQIVAALPLVQPPFNNATYQCDGQTLSLRLNAYPESIPPLQFQRQP
jgi:hypothetical protein